MGREIARLRLDRAVAFFEIDELMAQENIDRRALERLASRSAPSSCGCTNVPVGGQPSGCGGGSGSNILITCAVDADDSASRDAAP